MPHAPGYADYSIETNGYVLAKISEGDVEVEQFITMSRHGIVTLMHKNTNDQFWKWVKLNYKTQERYRAISTNTIITTSIVAIVLIVIFKSEAYFELTDTRRTDFSLDPDEVERELK